MFPFQLPKFELSKGSALCCLQVTLALLPPPSPQPYRLVCHQLQLAKKGGRGECPAEDSSSPRGTSSTLFCSRWHFASQPTVHMSHRKRISSSVPFPGLRVGDWAVKHRPNKRTQGTMSIKIFATNALIWPCACFPLPLKCRLNQGNFFLLILFS